MTLLLHSFVLFVKVYSDLLMMKAPGDLMNVALNVSFTGLHQEEKSGRRVGDQNQTILEKRLKIVHQLRQSLGKPLYLCEMRYWI